MSLFLNENVGQRGDMTSTISRYLRARTRPGFLILQPILFLVFHTQTTNVCVFKGFVVETGVVWEVRSDPHFHSSCTFAVCPKVSTAASVM